MGSPLHGQEVSSKLWYLVTRLNDLAMEPSGSHAEGRDPFEDLTVSQGSPKT